MHTSTRIILNTVTRWAASFVNALVSLMLVPFLLHQLGREGYGLIALVGVIVSMTMVADFGLSVAMTRHLAEQVATKNIRRFNELVSTGLLVNLVIGLSLASMCFIFAPFLTQPFKVPEALETQAVFLIRWYGSISILFSFILPVYTATITSNNRFDLQNCIIASLGVLKGVLIFAVLGLTETGLYGWAGVMLVSQAIQMLVTHHVARRVWPHLKVSFKYVRRDAVGMLFSLGGMLFLLQLTALLGQHTDPIILTTILGPAAVALYRPGLVLVMAAQPLVRALVDQLHPLATGYHTTGNSKELQRVLIQGTRYTLLMGIPVCVVLGVFAHPITKIWLFSSLGNDYRITAWVLSGWALITFFEYVGGSQWAVLLGMRRLKFVVCIRLPLAVVNIIVSILLVRYTSLGVAGVIVATIIIAIIRRPVFVVYTALVVGLRPMEYFLQSYFRPLLVLLIHVAIALVIRFWIHPNRLMVLGMCVVFLGVCWVGLCWWVGFDKNDRKSIRALLERILNTFVRRNYTGSSRTNKNIS